MHEKEWSFLCDGKILQVKLIILRQILMES